MNKRPHTRLLGVGAIALVLLLVAELALVLGLRGLTIREYFATRDPVAATAYYAMLVLFAVMPLLVPRRAGKGTKQRGHEDAGATAKR